MDLSTPTAADLTLPDGTLAGTGAGGITPQKKKRRRWPSAFFAHLRILQNQQQPQGHQQLLVGVLPEQEEQQSQKQQVPGIHAVQMPSVQEVAQKARQPVAPVSAEDGGGSKGPLSQKPPSEWVPL